MTDAYHDFLKNKIIVTEKWGFDIEPEAINPALKPHSKDLVRWAIQGGRRAIFASFGLHKTITQLEIGSQLIQRFNKPFLIVCPLGVSGEFKRDKRKFNIPHEVTYITDTDDFADAKVQIYLTNYERVRKGDIDPSMFCGVSFDEASILRNLQTDTTQYVLQHFKKVPFRFVATATPTPNDYIEILNYADYLGVISRGHALTRFFQRDSTKAGNLKLYDNKKKEFWQWVSTWAAFINTPSDLGYNDTGYVLPELNIVEHCIRYDAKEQPKDKWGTPILFKDVSKSLLEVSKEKRDSMPARMNKVAEIVEQLDGGAIVWHHLEAEREILERNFAGKKYASVYGSQPNELKEKLLIDFSEGEYDYLLSKAQIAGSGCNLQKFHNMIFAGINYKFNEFIQAIHREYRFGQTQAVNVHIIYTENEYEVMKALKKKWAQHLELQKQMIELVKENGLNSDLIKSQMERQIFKNGKKLVYDNVTVYNNDTVIVNSDEKEMPDNSVHMILASIPFGDHYEYSDNYNDFGHNHGNENFFKQMDFLTPHLLRILKPGRIAAIHVKDRIRYSYQNGTKFTTIKDFSGQTVAHFEKHGFYLMGKITVTTDVVAENNQTYRLGWTEQTKDATKMGVGLPEYVLIFRKAPTHLDNAYADEPVEKSKYDTYKCPDCGNLFPLDQFLKYEVDEINLKRLTVYQCPKCEHKITPVFHSKEETYSKALWQLDAHSYYRSNGNRFMTREELERTEVKRIVRAWKDLNSSEIYDFKEHLRICQELDEMEKLSSTFMTLPVHSNNEFVWTDVNRMKTLNANQVSAKKEKHICPLQFDIIERLINRYTKRGEIVMDPFGGLFSTPYKALEMGRKSISMELNTEYFMDGLFYLKCLMSKLEAPTLFDIMKEDQEVAA